jgi:nicotinate dehydrogenase subunit B
MRRRDFFAAVGGGIAVLLVDDAGAQQRGGRGGRGGQQMPQDVGAWLHIGEDGVVTAYTGKVEIGQNARTSLTAAVAEELRVPVASVRFIMGDTALTPFDGGTAGSGTTPNMWPQIRRAAATAREMLLDLAARKWNVDRASVSIANGKAASGSHSAGYGELTQGQKLVQTIAANVPLTPATEWKVAGTSVPKITGREIVTGAHKYPSDTKRPGMLHGRILYPPQFGAKLASLDQSAAAAIPGVKVVRDVLASPRVGFGGDVVGVVAPDSETAEKAVAALRAEWTPAAAQPSSDDVYTYFKQNAEGGPAAGAGLITYTIAYIAHVPLEPRAALAEWNEGKLTVWTGTQSPFGVRRELMAQFQLPEESVHVIMPDMGSGYGGKHQGDAAMEAAILAKAAGRPVQRNWTREEELTWAYFRPGAAIEVGGKANPDGVIAAWEFHNYNSGSSALRTPYHVPNAREQAHQTKSPLRQGSYRCLAATGNNFARECYMDELAHSIGMDPLAFRLKNASNDDRLRAVMEAAAERFGWAKRKKTPTHGFGMAAGFEKGGHVATCVEISVTNGAVKVLRVVEAFECGAVVNPEHLRNQVEGAISMGLGGALFERVEFAGGKISSNRLSRYRVPRFADMPVIESVLVDRKDLTSAGAGECPIIGIAPAVGNAIFDATGQRVRSLPMAPQGLVRAAGGAA